MNLESETPDITITRWRHDALEWKNRKSGNFHHATRTHRLVSVIASGDGIANLPAGFAAWLAGEGPPSPPIRVGDPVRDVVTSASGVVEWIGEPDKHGSDCLVRYDKNVLLETHLDRLERA